MNIILQPHTAWERRYDFIETFHNIAPPPPSPLPPGFENREKVYRNIPEALLHWKVALEVVSE